MLNRLFSRLLKASGHFQRSDSGATAVEFAIVAFPFFALLGVIIETGSMSVADFKALICQNASLVANCSSGVTVYANSYANWAQLAANMPSFMNIGVKDDGTPNPTSYKLGAPTCPSSVVATYDWHFMMPLMSYMGNVQGNTARRLVGFAMFQTEPYPSNGGIAC
jgi:Flp pilus assembly pilin Flp